MAFPLGDKRERGLDEVIRHDARMSGFTRHGAAEGHDDVVCLIVQRVFQRCLSNDFEGHRISGRLRCGAHEIHADAHDLARDFILIEDRAAIYRHADRQRFPGSCSRQDSAGQHDNDAEQEC